MTKIEISKEKIYVHGHSGYGTVGNDIVCAAISTLIEATYNYLKVTNNNVECEESEGMFTIKINKLNNTGNEIIKGFKDMCEDLSNQYPKNIEMR